MKRTSEITTHIHGAIGYGYTLTDAKKHAVSRIKNAFSGEEYGQDFLGYQPQMIRFPLGNIGLIYRNLDGWHYSIMRPDEIHKKGYDYCGTYKNQQDAEKMMRRDLSQDFWQDPVRNYGRNILDPMDEEGHKDLERYIKFQVAYERFQAEGKDEHTCHKLACESSDM